MDPVVMPIRCHIEVVWAVRAVLRLNQAAPEQEAVVTAVVVAHPEQRLTLQPLPVVTLPTTMTAVVAVAAVDEPVAVAVKTVKPMRLVSTRARAEAVPGGFPMPTHSLCPMSLRIQQVALECPSHMYQPQQLQMYLLPPEDIAGFQLQIRQPLELTTNYSLVSCRRASCSMVKREH